MICPRVAQRIECPECEYPASEALYMLFPDELNNNLAIDTTYAEEVIVDPGHKDEK